MCGIAGIYSLTGDPAQVELVASMTNQLQHRGPDGVENVAFGRVALGHNRLRIIDLTEAARQPLANEDGSISIIYNGEVYNYRELRNELRAAGHVFRSETDTEVIVHGYEQWGLSVLDRLNGMFAFALWDAPRQRLFCARDRIGVKPLYYTRSGGSLLFASEIKALLAVLPVAPTPDERAIADYVGLDYTDHTERTFFQGISQLPAGHRLVAEDGKIDVARWWDIPSPDEPVLGGAEAVQAFRELFEDSVRLRLRSDVPLGSCLSGGLDSSAVVGVVNALFEDGRDTEAVGHSLRTFSAVFPGEPFDESCYIDAVVAANRVEEHRVTLSPASVLDAARPVVLQQDEPFGSTSILAQWEVMRLARQTGVTVLLDGQGGDELLGGYHAFVGFRVADLIRRGHVRAAQAELFAYKRRQGTSWSRAARLAAVPFVPAMLRSRARLRDKAAGAALTSQLRGLASETRTSPPAGFGALASERYRVYKQGLPALLRYEDRNSMAFAIEARLPFLDYRLVELSFRLDPETLIHDGQTKLLLREALADRLPTEIRTREDKIGFETPQARWLREDARSIDTQLARSGFGGGYLKRAEVKALVDRQRNGESELSFAVWRCLCLDLWLEERIEGETADANGSAAMSHIEKVKTLPTL